MKFRLFLLSIGVPWMAAAAPLSARTIQALKPYGDLSPEVLAREHTRESLGELKWMGPDRLDEVAAYLREAGFELKSRLPRTKTFGRLSGRAKSVLKKLGHPDMADFVRKNTRCSLARRESVGPTVIDELTRYAGELGYELKDSEFVGLTERAKQIHALLGFPSILSITRSFTYRDFLTVNGVGKNIAREFERVAAQRGLKFRAEFRVSCKRSLE